MAHNRAMALNIKPFMALPHPTRGCPDAEFEAGSQHSGELNLEGQAQREKAREDHRNFLLAIEKDKKLNLDDLKNDLKKKLNIL